MKTFLTLIIACTLACLAGFVQAESGPSTLPKFEPYRVGFDAGLVTTIPKEVPNYELKMQGGQPAPSINYEAVYDFKDHATYAVVTKSMGPLTHVLGTKLTFESFGFGGVDTNGNPLAGVGAKLRFPLADQFDVFGGPAVLVKEGMPTRLMVYFGVSFRFQQGT